MTAQEIIDTSRQLNGSEIPVELTMYFEYKSGGLEADLNLEFRTQVVEALLNDFSMKDIQLIRALFDEEIKCEKAIWRHDNLYQLCFYLFHLGQLEDSFILYSAKFDARNMDVGMSLDREMMCVNHDVEEVIEYVEARFKSDAELKEKYPKMIEKLNELMEYPDYDSIADYHLFIRGYFYGHENVS